MIFLVLTLVFSSITQGRIPEEDLEVQSNYHRETTKSNLDHVRNLSTDQGLMDIQHIGEIFDHEIYIIYFMMIFQIIKNV
ncbi:unnamed protein product [Gordionus sp. m RMFG-2023]